MIKAILAVGENGEIGQDGDMPWGRSLPKDLRYFKNQTIYQEVLVGRNTFNTLPFGGEGFPERDTMVLTRSLSWESPIISEDGYVVYFFSEHELRTEVWNSLWIAGGSEVFNSLDDMIEEYHITRVKASFPDADTFFTPDLRGFVKIGEDIDVSSEELEAYVEVWRKVS